MVPVPVLVLGCNYWFFTPHLGMGMEMMPLLSSCGML